MASIEERAEEFADAMVKGAFGTRNDYYDSYIKGAIDQRKIDIEKACKWLQKELDKLVMKEINDNFLKNEFKIVLEHDIPKWLNNLKQAMKEE